MRVLTRVRVRRKIFVGRMLAAVFAWNLGVWGMAVEFPPPGAESWWSFRNGNAQLGVSASSLPEKLELLWTFKAGEQVVSTAAIVGPHVYVASLKGEVHCLRRSDGTPVWTYRSKATTDPKEFLPGFKASPTVTDDSVYLGDEDGVFHAIERATGKKRWTFETGGEIVSSATLFGDQVVFGSHDNSLYCLNRADGSKVWQFTTEGMVNCSPAIVGNHTFITGCDEHLRVVDVATGKQVRDIPLNTYLIASPAVVGNRLYVGTYASEVVAVDWESGQTAWTYKDPQREFPYHSSAAVTDQYVVLGGHDKRVHCIDRKTGKRVWRFSTRAKVESSPAIVGNRVFIGSNDGNLYCLNLADGAELWRHTDGQAFKAGAAIGEGVLVIGVESKEGTVYCFGAR